MKDFFLYPICKILDIMLPSKLLKGIPVLMYHSIGDKDGTLSLHPEVFESQIKFLKDCGYKTILPVDFYNADFESERIVVITFDDGYRDNLDVAMPILRKYGFKAVIFIIISIIGSEGMLDEEGIKKLVKEGWVIANHSVNHKKMTDIGDQEIINEYTEARDIIINLTGNEYAASVLAYPRNRYNQNVINILKKAGLKVAFVGGNNIFNNQSQLLCIPRIDVSQNISFKKFKLYLSPSFYLLKRIFKK